MRNSTSETLPPRVKRALAKLGGDIAFARKKRGLTTHMMAERLGVARSTYHKVERGEPSVALGTYAMTFFVLGFGDALGQILDARMDEQGLLLDAERLPRRVRTPRGPKPL